MNENIGRIFSISKSFDWDDWLIDSDALIDDLCYQLHEKIPDELDFELVSKYMLECIRPMGYEYRIIVYKDLPMLVMCRLNFDTETVKVIVKFVTRKKEDVS